MSGDSPRGSGLALVLELALVLARSPVLALALILALELVCWYQDTLQQPSRTLSELFS